MQLADLPPDTPLTVQLTAGIWQFLIAAGNEVPMPRRVSQPIMATVEAAVQQAVEPVPAPAAAPAPQPPAAGEPVVYPRSPEFSPGHVPVNLPDFKPDPLAQAAPEEPAQPMPLLPMPWSVNVWGAGSAPS